MIPPPLAELIAAADKATPGPWRALQYAVYGPCTHTGRDGNIAVSHNNGRPNALADADFIVAARNSIPHLKALLARLEAAEEVVDGMMGAYASKGPKSPWQRSHEYRQRFPREDK